MILNKNSPTKFPNSAAGRTIAPGSLTFFDCEKNLNGLLNFYSNLQNDFAVAHTPNKKDWSKWLNWTDWKHERKLLPNYRQILGTEVVLEYDYPDRKTNLMVTKKVMEVLRKKGYNYRCYFTGKKSFHVHLMFLVLQELEKEKQVRVKKLWVANTFEPALVEDLDYSNLGKRTLIQIEGAANPTTGKLKHMVAEHGDWMENTMPKEIIEQAKKEPEIKMVGELPTPKTCAFCEFALENKLPEGNRYTRLCPSLSAYTRAIKDRTQVRKRFQLIQDKDNPFKDSLGEWDNVPSMFVCTALQNYAQKIGLGHICTLCIMKKARGGNFD